MSFYRIRAH